MVYAQARIHPGKWDTQTSLGFWDTNRSSNLGQRIRRSDSQQKNRTCWIMEFAIPADHQVKLKESEKRNKYLDLSRKLKKTVEHKGASDTNCEWCARYTHKRIGTGTGGLGNKRTSGDYPNYSISEIDQNTEKSPGDLRRLAVTQTPVKDHQLALVWKKSQKGKIIIIIPYW